MSHSINCYTMSVQFCSINATESDFLFDVPTMAWVDTKEYKRRGIQIDSSKRGKR